MKRIVFLCLAVIVFAGCAGGKAARKAPRYPNPETPEARVVFDDAHKKYLAGRFGEADALFSRTATEFPYTELTDRSNFYRGEIAFSKNNLGAAYGLYRQSYSKIQSPNVAPMAMFKAALCLHRQSRFNEALAELKTIEREDASAVLKLRADSLGVIASKAAGKEPKEYALYSLFLLDDYAEGAGSKASGVAVSDLVSERAALEGARNFISDDKVGLEDIKSYPLDAMKGKKSGGYVQYKRAYILHGMGDDAAATKLLKSFLSSYPKHELYGDARNLMTELGGVVGDAAGVAVGAILPLSGRYSAYGESVLHGMECAAGIYEPCRGPSGIKIIVKDGSLPGKTVSNLVEELANEGVVAIVGPMISRDAMDAASKAQELGLPMIALSQHPGIVGIGNYVFRNFVTPSSEVDTIVGYAFSKRGFKNFFILYPDSKKGVEYRDLFSSAVARLGGKITGKYGYAPNQTEFGSELRGRGSAEEMVGAISGSAHDAIFIPDSFDYVGYLVPALANAGIEKAQYLGISRWDDPALVERGGGNVEGALFVDSFFKGAKGEEVSRFVSNYTSAFGTSPTLLEALGFDSMRIVLAAVQEKGNRSRETVRSSIASTANFPGVTGRLSFGENGDSRRELYVLTVKDGAILQVSK